MMLEVHGPETPAIVAAYDFSQFKHIIDIGGGNGSLLSAILAAHPRLRATLFDLPEGIAAAKRGEGGPLPGVTLAAGDVFEAVPEGGDLYLFRHLLHDYADDEAVKILHNIRRAMRPDARVLVLEKPVPVDDTPGPGRWLDLHVMLLTGGAERTLEEYSALFARADLKLARVPADRASGDRSDRSGRRPIMNAVEYCLLHGLKVAGPAHPALVFAEESLSYGALAGASQNMRRPARKRRAPGDRVAW